MQINQATVAALFKGYRVQFLEAYQAGKAMWDQIAMRTTSNAAEEIYHWLGSVPGLRRLVGEVAIENLTAHNYSIKNDEFAVIVQVKQADVERDAYGLYNPMFQSLGLAAKQHPDELVSGLLINGFSQTDYTGKNFFDANKKAEPDTKFPFTNKDTRGLGPQSFADARTSIKSRLNAKGRPMNLGQDLLLVVSPQNEVVARQILQADFIQQTAQGGTQGTAPIAAVTNVNKGTARFVVWPQLASNPNMWFLMDVGYPVRPFILQVEKEVQLLSLTQATDDVVFHKHVFEYQAYGRYNAGYGLPELAFGSTGTTAAA